MEINTNLSIEQNLSDNLQHRSKKNYSSHIV